MRSTVEGHGLNRGHRVALGLAPHVDPDWAEQLAIELPIHTDTSARAMVHSLLPTGLQLLGMLILVRGFTAWRESGQLEVTTAQLAVVGVVVLMGLLLAKFADPVVRFTAHYPVLAVIIAMACGAPLGFSSRFPNEGICQIAAGWSLAAGSAALIGGAVWAIMRRPASPSQDGPVTSPLDPKGTYLGYGRPGPLLKLVSSSMLGTVCFTSLTVVLLAWIWWLTRAR